MSCTYSSLYILHVLGSIYRLWGSVDDQRETNVTASPSSEMKPRVKNCIFDGSDLFFDLVSL